MSGEVVAIHLCPRSRAPLLPVREAEALLDAGLRGDRHARAGSRRQVLFVEQEVLEMLDLVPGEIREQVTVRGLDLNALASGRRFRLGGVVLEVAGPCDPCERMDEIRPGLRRTLEGRRGRFMSVVGAGKFSVGDRLEDLPGA